MSKKNFFVRVAISQQRTEVLINLGMKRVERRGKKWLKFFMFLPIVGRLAFYREGLKEEKERRRRKR